MRANALALLACMTDFARYHPHTKSGCSPVKAGERFSYFDLELRLLPFRMTTASGSDLKLWRM